MLLVLAWLLTAVAAAGPVEAPRLRTAAMAGDWQAVQAMGRAALPELVRLYSQSSPRERATIAQVFYNLGWKSEEAKGALMVDAHTTDPDLRLQVQCLQALSILTHQTKGFEPNGAPQARSVAVEAWKRWLAEYRANL
jgi:hypothetical protein